VEPEDLPQPPRYVLAGNMAGQPWVVDTAGKVVYIADDLDVDAPGRLWQTPARPSFLHRTRPTLTEAR
jgi:hypothetical protein